MYDSEHDALITAAVLGGVWGTLVPAEARGLGDMDPRRIGAACGLPGASGGGSSIGYQVPVGPFSGWWFLQLSMGPQVIHHYRGGPVTGTLGWK